MLWSGRTLLPLPLPRSTPPGPSVRVCVHRCRRGWSVWGLRVGRSQLPALRTVTLLWGLLVSWHVHPLPPVQSRGTCLDCSALFGVVRRVGVVHGSWGTRGGCWCVVVAVVVVVVSYVGFVVVGVWCCSGLLGVPVRSGGARGVDGLGGVVWQAWSGVPSPAPGWGLSAGRTYHPPGRPWARRPPVGCSSGRGGFWGEGVWGS